jgi:hypothetical protein
MKRKAKRPTKSAAPNATKSAVKRPTKGRSARTAAGKIKANTETQRAEKAAARPSQAAPPDAIDVLVEAGTKALGLPLDPAWKAAVKFNLQLILQHAARVEEFPLPDDAEPAPVYHA